MTDPDVRFLRRESKPAYANPLREMILRMTPADAGVEPGTRRIWAALMETGLDRGTYSLVVVAEGAVSLYYSTGGGIIGAGEHEPVRAAGAVFLDAVDAGFDHLAPADELPLPGPGEVRLNALGFDGRFSAAAPEEALGEGRHPLSGVFYAGHDVITQVRIVDEHTRQG